MATPEQTNLRVIDGPPGETEDSGDLNTRILMSLMMYLEDEFEADALHSVAAAAGMSTQQLDRDTNHWISWEAFEAFIAASRRRMSSDAEFIEACRHRQAESYGVWKYGAWAMSVPLMYKAAAKNMPVLCTIADPSVDVQSRTETVITYRSTKPESHLMCLSRVSQLGGLPSFFDLPPATVVSKKCIANGDECCEYHIKTYELWRGWPVVVGGALGGAAALIISLLHAPTWLLLAAFMLLGAVAGFAIEERRVNRLNLRSSGEVQGAWETVAVADGEARREILALNQRVTHWSRMVEKAYHERSLAIEDVMQRMNSANKMRQSTIRGVSHDLRNPLTWLSVETDLLHDYLDGKGSEAEEIMQNHATSVERMQKLLGELVEVAVHDRTIVPVTPEVMKVAPLSEHLGRRLNALVRGGPVSTSVFATREAPDQIETDKLVFDRVVDNLLSNSAKYTMRGQITVELDGTPGFLSIKVSDTGKGISPERLRRVFDPESQPEPDPTTTNSLGVGLGVVVQLMDQIGGRLEVMSREDQGTTVWAHFPTELAVVEPDGESDDLEDSIVDRVVTFRAPASA